MSVRRNLKLNRYRAKDRGIYTVILLFYLFLISGMAFLIYNGTIYYLRIGVCQMLHLYTPVVSLLWILPVIGECIDSKWGELFCSLKPDTVFQIVFRNVILDIILLIPFYFFTQVYGSFTMIYIQLLLLNIFIQCIGIAAYYLSDSVYTAYGIPLLYTCFTIFTLLDPDKQNDFAYVASKELTMSDFLYIHGWKIFLTVVMAVLSAKRVKK